MSDYFPPTPESKATRHSLTCQSRCGFEAVTVRAAVRLVRLRHAAALTPEELAWYLAELTDLDQRTRCPDSRVLARLAERAAARGGQVGCAPTRWQRSECGNQDAHSQVGQSRRFRQRSTTPAARSVTRARR